MKDPFIDSFNLVDTSGTPLLTTFSAMSKASVMTIPKDRRASKRLTKKTIIFQILNREPELSAPQLQKRARDADLDISLLFAYRALKAYRDSEGKLENSETKCLNAVSLILQNAQPGEHLTAAEIKLRAAAQQHVELHKATVYRVLARLSAMDLVLAIDRGRQKFYEWKRADFHHGHLSCIDCGETIEFHQDYLDEVANQICKRLNYSYNRIEFIVRSLCPQCREK